jgi:selenoprotein W-related protein
LKKEFAVETALMPSSGGVFEVSVDGENVFSKIELKRFPQDGEIVRLVREKLMT